MDSETNDIGWIEQPIRASSIKDALDCAMRFEARALDKVRMPSSGVSHLGTAIHAGTAAYDQSVLAGAPISTDAAAGRFVDMLKLDQNPEEPEDDGVRWEDDSERRHAEEVGIKGVVNYIDKIGSRRRYSAVEAKLDKFSIRFPEPKVIIVLSGKTDRIRSLSEGNGISDLKSGKSRCTKEGKVHSSAEKAQLAVYELVAEKALNLKIEAPAEIIGVSTTHGSVGTLQVTGTRAALVGTSDGTPGALDFVARMLRAGLFPPNPASYLCSPKFCPIYNRCPYHD